MKNYLYSSIENNNVYKYIKLYMYVSLNIY